ncbi:MAG TPA: PQQ-dependent sugar dehydrogenase, partial [Methylomirabilota bacterium]|nr:PQQ-dependent sugar dehydrogenase [Methylomirabilota bacterium]
MVRQLASLGLRLGWILVLLGAPPTASAAITLQQVATGLDRPTAIAHAGNGSGRLFVALQAGRIVVFDGTRVLPTPFLDITPRVGSGGERGLLGLAFHPNYIVNGFFYIHYTNLAGHIVIARYRVSSNPNLANPGSALVLLTIPHPGFSNHNGGQLQFGPDGYLYVGVGDGGGGGDPGNNAQNLGTLLGKLLRLDVNGPAPYVAPGNPFGNQIWAFGLRNPWRFSFDRLTGDLFIADVGQGSREEVNFQPARSPGGVNYGWRRMEGSQCFNPASNCNDGTLTLPILEYDHSGGNCSITGGYRYRGARVPELSGAYVFGDFCSGRVWRATPNGDGSWTTTQLLDTPHLISTFGEDQAGELYLAHYAAAGVLYRIVHPQFGAGVFVAGGHIGGAASDQQIVAGAAFGVAPRVRTFRTNNTPFGPTVLAYANRFLGGVRVAACDVDGDGQADLLTGAGPGGGPHVKVTRLDATGAPIGVLASFLAFSRDFTG